MVRSHGKLIDLLGGTFAVARLCDVNPRVVSNWRKRGVSRAWRPLLAEKAREKGVDLPREFLIPKGRA